MGFLWGLFEIFKKLKNGDHCDSVNILKSILKRWIFVVVNYMSKLLLKKQRLQILQSQLCYYTFTVIWQPRLFYICHSFIQQKCQLWLYAIMPVMSIYHGGGKQYQSSSFPPRRPHWSCHGAPSIRSLWLPLPDLNPLSWGCITLIQLWANKETTQLGNHLFLSPPPLKQRPHTLIPQLLL